MQASHAYRRLAADRHGATAIEFALVFLPFVAMLLGILNIALIFFTQQLLETAAERSARQLMTGQAQKAGMSQPQYKAVVCGFLPAYINCGRLVVDVRTLAQFSDASSATITYDRNGNPTSNGQYQPGAANTIVMAQVIYPWLGSGSMPLGFTIGGPNGPLTQLRATTVFRTENFQ